MADLGLSALAVRLGLRVLGSLPTGIGLRFGALLGRLFCFASPRRVGIALVNLRIAFPEWSEERRRRVMREAFANLGRSLFEVAELGRLSEGAVCERIELEGLEHLEAARRSSPSGGVIALTAHLGNWELMGAAMALRGFPLTVVHRARGDARVESVIRSWRERWGIQAVPRGSAARTVLTALREGRIVGLPLDQNADREEGIFVPFFDRLACTRHGPARVALRTAAPVVPVFAFRVGAGPRHRVRIEPALDLADAGETPDGAIRENVRRMNRAIEAAIRLAPEQWSWTHRRWRTQPRGEPRPYRSRRTPGVLASLLPRLEHRRQAKRAARRSRA